MKKITDAEKERVKNIYDCEDSPLIHQIKPRGTFDIIESRKIQKKDLQS
ncbi:MAG: hypothetical protein R1F52_02900 [Candidatus Nitrosoabyssus spongiisocia]|nr:MAG: hypothetical protein R1F52_02900 [Nitrosopumilaceae archaeon AB1(1)]